MPDAVDSKWKLKVKFPFLFADFEKKLSWDAKRGLKYIRDEIMAYRRGERRFRDLFLE